ncbi:MAG TPA: hypothetical protein VK892_21800 [Pyrinomonadaceae bacterium]|nr:hypothetical protein [Pyrinomonadaceae bacterium]
MKRKLTVSQLLKEARTFADVESLYNEPYLFGKDNGKDVGTYVELKLKNYLGEKYKVKFSSAASGIDLPELEVDIKVTSIIQPQSSCPYRSARQKIFGLGYSLLIFVYSKTNDEVTKTSNLNFLHTIFVDKERTADYQTTTGLRQILENNGNADDLVSFMLSRNLPLDDIEAYKIAEEILSGKPIVEGYLTISNALQWRLQYGRVIAEAGNVDGIWRVK